MARASFGVQGNPAGGSTPSTICGCEFSYEYVFDKLAIDVINGSSPLREWVDDPNTTAADLDAIAVPDEEAWIAERAKYLIDRATRRRPPPAASRYVGLIGARLADGVDRHRDPRDVLVARYPARAGRVALVRDAADLCDHGSGVFLGRRVKAGPFEPGQTISIFCCGAVCGFTCRISPTCWSRR